MAQMESENSRSNWELSKENIQPLSSGRNMASLTRSLETSSLPHEAEISDNIREFEEDALNYIGNDPLEPWIRLINYFEQNCLSCDKYTQKYSSVLSGCVRKFLYEDKQKNDKRFIEVFLKSVRNFQPERRTLILTNALSNGVGAEVSRMYVAIADEYEKVQQFNLASDVLQKGIEQNAQPFEYLEAALTNLQFRVAEVVSKSVRESKDGYSISSSLRSFGGSIPCAPTNEAPSIRMALSPANPTRSKPRNDLKKILLFQDENDEKVTQPSLPFNTVKQIEMMKNEKENEMNPTRWNEANSQMISEINVGSQIERIALYVDTEEDVITSANARKNEGQQRPALSEIKVTESLDSVEVSKVVHAPPVVIIGDTFAPVHLPPRTQIYLKSQLWQNNREVSFEHLRAAEYRRKKYDKLKRKADVRLNQNVQAGFLGKDNTNSAIDIDRSNERIQKLEDEVKFISSQFDECMGEKQKISVEMQKLSDEKRKLLDEIGLLKKQHLEVVQREVQHARNQCIEGFHAELLKVHRERSELLINLREEKLRRLTLDDEYTRLNQEYKKFREGMESHSISALQKENASGSTKVDLYADVSLYPPANICAVPPRHSDFDDQNKENEVFGNYGGRTEEKTKRTIVGVLMPSISAEPQALVFEEDAMDYNVESENTEVILKKNETEVDFNVSNLTRALKFLPKPLENSTPERVKNSDSMDFAGGHHSLFPPLSSDYGSSSSASLGTNQTNINYQRQNFNQTFQTVQNLSTIQETSKENRSSCTTSGSSSSRTTASTFSSTGNFTRSCSRYEPNRLPQ